jgi:hypothetical protein
VGGVKEERATVVARLSGEPASNQNGQLPGREASSRKAPSTGTSVKVRNWRSAWSAAQDACEGCVDRGLRLSKRESAGIKAGLITGERCGRR